FYLFFFQAEDGIRDFHVTGVQTCALPISKSRSFFLMVSIESRRCTFLLYTLTRSPLLFRFARLDLLTDTSYPRNLAGFSVWVMRVFSSDNSSFSLVPRNFLISSLILLLSA